MTGMAIADIRQLFTDITEVFPGTKLHSIQIQQETGTMAMIKFSAEDVGEGTGEFTLLPAGKYTGQISNHEWKATKTGGHMLVLTFEITDGAEGIGRKVWDNLNLDCASEDAQKIALRSYKAICSACNALPYYEGIFEVEDDADAYFESMPENLYGQDIAIKIGIEKGKDNYPDKNKIQMYGESTGKPAAASAKPAATAGKAKPAWAK